MNPQTYTAPACADMFDAPIPRGLRDRIAGLTWEAVLRTYGQAAGPVRLGSWECTDAREPARRYGPPSRNFKATLAFRDRIATATASAGGPVAALTAMLYDLGVALETLEFHQLRAGAYVATFIRGCAGTRDDWALGYSADATESALRAVVACANRLSA